MEKLNVCLQRIRMALDEKQEFNYKTPVSVRRPGFMVYSFVPCRILRIYI